MTFSARDGLRVLAPLLVVSVLIGVSIGIIILWPGARSLEHHVTLTVSHVRYNGTHLTLIIHFVMPENESLLCFGFRDRPNGELASFTETTFRNGDLLTHRNPNQLGLPRGVPFHYWLASRIDGAEVDWPIDFEIPFETGG